MTTEMTSASKRINITDSDESTGGRCRPVGWFDIAAAEWFGAAQDPSGDTSVDRNTGSTSEHQALYRTAGGRWVLEHRSDERNAAPRYHYISIDKAREWLMHNDHDEAVERIFAAPVESERGPGRPEIGPSVEVRIPTALLRAVDEIRSVNGEHDVEWLRMPRAEVVRRLLMYAVYGGEAVGSDPAALWRERRERVAASTV